ncbi:LPXTG cell wall anchor domain-containing protein [Blautia luti]|uniref:LPXTG cell wall anchor domain-containing protein n=1 Tax=Blautia TaxID=572511 RepID=UPI0016425B14|nr:LPXTG cell wall anchor domain-containing protein [Blautia luti]
MKKSGQTGRNDSNGTKKDTTTGNISTSIYSPQTGDTTDLSGYVLTLIASLTVITGWLILRKKKME